jgi:pyruvate dehydrogenase E1 component beta subunit
MKTSVKKTHYLLAVEFGWPQCGIGSEIIARICESKFEFIKIKNIFSVIR